MLPSLSLWSPLYQVSLLLSCLLFVWPLCVWPDVERRCSVGELATFRRWHHYRKGTPPPPNISNWKYTLKPGNPTTWPLMPLVVKYPQAQSRVDSHGDFMSEPAMSCSEDVSWPRTSESLCLPFFLLLLSRCPWALGGWDRCLIRGGHSLPSQILGTLVSL